MEKHLHVFRTQPPNWSVVCALVSVRIPPHVHREYITDPYVPVCTVCLMPLSDA